MTPKEEDVVSADESSSQTLRRQLGEARAEMATIRAERDNLAPKLAETRRLIEQLKIEIAALQLSIYTPISLAYAINAVIDRRRAQNEKWGEQNHDPILWSAILTEECGEFAQAALHNRFGGKHAEELRDEAIDCAAVALQIIECFDRNSPAPSSHGKDAA